MSETPRLKPKYVLAKCCTPTAENQISGYFSFDDMIKVHRTDCTNLSSAPAERLIQLEWNDVLAPPEFSPDERYHTLDKTDFAILDHHDRLGVDYSLKVAADLNIPKKAAFEHHKILLKTELIKRIEGVMIRYRKGVVDNIWIKHRNHTYYDITTLGQKFLEFKRKSS